MIRPSGLMLTGSICARTALSLARSAKGDMAAELAVQGIYLAAFSNSLVKAGLIALIGGHIGWVYAGMLPVALLIGLYTRLRLRRLTRQQMTRSNERQGLLIDSIRGAETIRASHAGWRFAQDWQALSQSISGYSIQQKALAHFSATTTARLCDLP